MSIGEILKTAGIDTALGMGTVFLVLILVSAVIWLMGIICRKLDAAGEKSGAAGGDVSGAAGGDVSGEKGSNTGVGSAEGRRLPAINADGLTPELVAAISTVAISQYKRDFEKESAEGDEYIVRNIRRASWKRI